MLIGGADVDPQFYGHEHLDVTEQVYPERDAFELALVSKALEMDVPFLGVCRGLQILNVALGGTLKQDIADDEGQNLHRRRLGGFEGTDHIVSIDPGSRLHGVIGDASTTVRCHHHQAIDELGHGLTVTARADADELVEAVELPSNRFALGVQWHPEADTRSRVIAGLIEACNAGDETVREIQLDRMV
jgi:putative glutamine amidotransferase